MENTHIGPFHILEKLGSHRRHNVFRARQTEQGREVALKFINLPPDIDRESVLARVNREVVVLKQLEHPHLVKMFGAGIADDSRIFFAHELIEGETLAALLSRRGRLAADLVIDYGGQVASVLEYLHHNEIIHSKLTTDKLIVDADGQIHVADLRLNRSRKRRWDAARRATLETAAYMPPEQLLGKGATAKSDLYALGVIMFEMLTGRLPYEPQTMAQLCRDKQSRTVPRVSQTVMSCPAWLDKLIRKSLDPDPKSRPHSARAMIMTLEQISSVDQRQTASAAEITRGFSALSMGADRTAARRALGLRKRVVEPENELPLLHSIPVLAGGLLLIAMIVSLYVFWPFGGNPMELKHQADLLLASDDSDDWREARELYTRIMKRSRDEALTAAAEEGYFRSRRKSMLYRLQNGASPLERPEIRELYAIMEIETAGEWRDAMHRYERLMENIEPLDDMRYVRWEAADRLDRLRELEKEAIAFRERYQALVTAAGSPDATDEDVKALEEAREELETISRDNLFLADLHDQPTID